MKIAVDMDACEGHGRCAFVAPAVFQLDENLDLTFDPAPAEELRAEVKEAIAACPEQAIRELSATPK
jgi:ferredoxin